MTTIQIVALIIGSIAILAIISGAILIKKKDQGTGVAGIRLDPALSEAEENALDSQASSEVATDMGNTRVSTTTITADAPPVLSINQARLRELYKKAATDHKKSIKSISSGIAFFLICQGLLMAFALVAIFATSAAGDSGSDGAVWLIMLLGVGLYVGILFYYTSNRNKSVETSISSIKYVGLSTSQFPAIWALCTDLMAKMDLAGFSLKIFYAKTDAFEANVLVDKDEVYLLLSRSLISYFHSNPKDVASILGHEFGHVYQGDTKMLLVNRRSIQIPGIIGTVSVIILIIQVIASLAQGHGLPQAGGSFVLVLYYWQLVGLRKNAEYLADMASVAFVEDSTLPQLIEKYMPEQGTFNYPSRLQRLKFIETAQSKAGA